jgi:small conductance mechanosensitive channel
MYARVAKQLREHAAHRARRARTQILLIVPLVAGVVFAYSHRRELFGLDVPVRVACVVALLILGWSFAMNLGRAVGPTLLRRLDPGTAGTVSFLIRLLALILSVTFALRLAGLRPETLAVGGAITAVILGLAAQQTIGNLIAGTVLMSARPFRVGDRVRMHAGGVAGQVEGTVTSVGLLYVTLANGEERIEEKVSVPTRNDPQIDLEEFEDGDVVVRIRATPVTREDGPALADQVVEALDEVHTVSQAG